MNAPEPLRAASPSRIAALALGCGLTVATVAVPLRAGELEIEWRAPDEPVQGFVIERRPESGGERALVARLGPEARLFVDDAVPGGARVCYRVRAILRDGSWAPSAEHCVSPPPEATTVETIDVAVPEPLPLGDGLPDVAAPGPPAEAQDLDTPRAEPADALPEPDVPPSGPARISDRFKPVSAERFLGKEPTAETD